MSKTGFTRRTALATSAALAQALPAMAAAAGQRSPRQLLQAFVDTLNALDLKGFRALYLDEGTFSTRRWSPMPTRARAAPMRRSPTSASASRPSRICRSLPTSRWWRAT
jgi:hypothetical protein